MDSEDVDEDKDDEKKEDMRKESYDHEIQDNSECQELAEEKKDPSSLPDFGEECEVESQKLQDDCIGGEKQGKRDDSSEDEADNASEKETHIENVCSDSSSSEEDAEKVVKKSMERKASSCYSTSDDEEKEGDSDDEDEKITKTDKKHNDDVDDIMIPKQNDSSREDEKDQEEALIQQQTYSASSSEDEPEKEDNDCHQEKADVPDIATEVLDPVQPDYKEMITMDDKSPVEEITSEDMKDMAAWRQGEMASMTESVHEMRMSGDKNENMEEWRQGENHSLQMAAMTESVHEMRMSGDKEEDMEKEDVPQIKEFYMEDDVRTKMVGRFRTRIEEQKVTCCLHLLFLDALASLVRVAYIFLIQSFCRTKISVKLVFACTIFYFAYICKTSI